MSSGLFLARQPPWFGCGDDLATWKSLNANAVTFSSLLTALLPRGEHQQVQFNLGCSTAAIQAVAPPVPLMHAS